MLTKDQETWSDTLYYHRAFNDVEMLGQVELMDTTRNVFAVAGRVEYTDSLTRVKMTRTPAVMSIDEDEKTHKRDTVYFGADTILYRGVKRHLVDSLWKVEADKRLKDLVGDPVTEYRRKAAEAAAKAAEEAKKNDPNAAAKDKGPGGAKGGEAPPKEGVKPGSGDAPTNTGADGGGTDNPDGEPPKKSPADTTAPAPPAVDTTQLSFIWATSRVKLYREDMQMSCDSLAYGDLDSLVRLYRDPLVFSDGNRQYSADSIYVVIKDKKADRARLMSEAFITTQEDTLCYDQIKGTEMMAYFDSTRTLRRFDALGGATALFFLTENDALATVNKVESKMLYALFDDGKLDKIYYFDNAKNDAYPVVQLPKDERYMKGFRWDPERRPRGRRDITPLVPRASQRTSYLARPHAEFKETDKYFPGHIKKIYKDIAYRDSMAVVKARQPKETPATQTPVDTAAVAPPVDTTGTAPPVDKAQAADDDMADVNDANDAVEVAAPADTTAVGPPANVTSPTGTAAADSAALTRKPPFGKLPVKADAETKDEADEKDGNTVEEIVLDPQALKKEQERAAKEAEKARKAEEKRLKDEEKARIEAEKRAAKEAKWAEEDRIYQEKQAAKQQKKLEKERKKKLRALKKLEKKAQKERRVFERYLAKERKRAEKQAARDADKAREDADKAREDNEPEKPN